LQVASDKENLDLVQRIDRATEVPMLILSSIYLVVFVLEYLPDLPQGVRGYAVLAEYFIAAGFAADLVVKFSVANDRIAFLRTHWIDILIVLVPFLRPLRFLSILRIAPVVLRYTRGLRRVMGHYRVTHVLIIGLSSVLLSAVLVTIFERHSGGHIKTFGDALWWTIATITTVGYGDMVPVSAPGRAVAVFLMLIGISLFGVLTAGIAAYFVEDAAQKEEESKSKELSKRLERIEARIEEQNKVLAALLAQYERQGSRR
jgi:voltage-gated potassium channel